MYYNELAVVFIYVLSPHRAANTFSLHTHAWVAHAGWWILCDMTPACSMWSILPPCWLQAWLFRPCSPPFSMNGPGPLCWGNMAALHCMLGHGSKPTVQGQQSQMPVKPNPVPGTATQPTAAQNLHISILSCEHIFHLCLVLA